MVPFFLAFALVVGQQAVLLHDLGHAVHPQEHGTPAELGCDTHSLCAQLGSAVGASAPAIPQVLALCVPILAHFSTEAPQRTRLAYRSHAPPAAPA